MISYALSYNTLYDIIDNNVRQCGQRFHVKLLSMSRKCHQFNGTKKRIKFLLTAQGLEPCFALCKEVDLTAAPLAH